MNAIVAVNQDWAIGKNGNLISSIKEDLAEFKRLTKGKMVVYGRKTLESFPNKKILPDRINVVITRNLENEAVKEAMKCCPYSGILYKDNNYNNKNNLVIKLTKFETYGFTHHWNAHDSHRDAIGTLIACNNISTFIEFINAINYCTDDIYICGGGEIYKQLYKYCNNIYVTKTNAQCEDPDTFFPNLDKDEDFSIVELEDGPIVYTGINSINNEEVKFSYHLYKNNNSIIYTDNGYMLSCNGKLFKPTFNNIKR